MSTVYDKTWDLFMAASMSDDTLYGTIQEGQSKPFPAGMTFS